jgi:hypothetical protein
VIVIVWSLKRTTSLPWLNFISVSLAEENITNRTIVDGVIQVEGNSQQQQQQQSDPSETV